MLAGTYGIKNLEIWTMETGEGCAKLKGMYSQLLMQYNLYIKHAAKNIGGIHYTSKSIEQPGALYEVVPYAVQKEAVSFLNKNIFITPKWLFNKDINQKIGVNSNGIIVNLQFRTLQSVLSPVTMNKLINAQVTEGTRNYGFDDLFSDLTKDIWEEIYNHQPIDVYRRSLQRSYFEELSDVERGNIPICFKRARPFTATGCLVTAT